MKGRILVNVNGKDIDIKELPEEKRKKLAEEWNRRALEVLGYKRVNTA